MKHLFFDLDRTLWDFEQNSKKALEHLFDVHDLGQVIKSFESFHRTYKQHNAVLWNRYGKGKISKEELRVKRFRDTLQYYQIFDKNLADQISEGYIKVSPYQTELFPGTHETLQELNADGYELHIITNGFKEVQYIKLDQSELRDYFDVIVCSEVVGVNKPDPKVFNFAMDNAKANPDESVMIGDDFKVDVLGAENAGMKGVLFDPHEKYKRGTHDWHIKLLEELPDQLKTMKKIT